MTKSSSKGSSYAVKAGKILRIKQLTESEKYFEIQLPNAEPLGHEPGQFVMISIPGLGEAPISVSSPPALKESFELVIRRAGTVTDGLHKLSAGDTVGIRGPFGRGFPVAELEQKDLLLIGGGCGNIPLRSLIKHVLADPKRYGKITILSGCKTPEMFLFLDEISEWSKVPGVSVEIIVDRAGPSWKAKVGLITTLIPSLVLDPSKTYAVVIGPPIMYKFVVQELMKKHIPHNQIILSLERHMKCGVGKCGHCQIESVYCCQDGPVFTYKEIEHNLEAI